MENKRNMILNIDGKSSKLYMPFSKTLSSAQGMAIYDNEAFILYHTGVCSVYDLLSRSDIPKASFRLASYNGGFPSQQYINHANQAMFSSNYYRNNNIPLLYVTTGNDGGEDENGFYYRCAVENIIKRKNEAGDITFTSELLQTIHYKNTGIEDTTWETPCWGAPAFFVDSENNFLYIFSARYRTTKAFSEYYSKNAYIITKFSLPGIDGEKNVILTASEILDQFTVPFDIPFTQGGTLYQDKIYYTFGFGNNDYPIGIRIYDLKHKCIAARIDLSHSVLANEEIECCSFYKGNLLYNTNSGNIYMMDLLSCVNG